LPVEVNAFGLEATTRAVAQVCAASGGVQSLTLRTDRDEEPFVTDGGHHILDAAFGHISDPKGLEQALYGVAGVVETGLFLGIAKRALIASVDGIKTFEAPSGA
ncbi:MAG: ribose-5-phosphate isomerase A, partial [Pseudomonadota bacterium]